MRILLAQINPTVGDLPGNTAKIVQCLTLARQRAAEVVLFPEMAVCGYPPEDLLLLPSFIQSAEESLVEIISHTKGLVALVGTVRQALGQKSLYNTAAIISDGKLLGFQDKLLLPTYDVFDEARYFEPGVSCQVWDLAGKRVAVTICEDIWQHGDFLAHTSYPRDPILEVRDRKPDILLNLSASPFSMMRSQTRYALCRGIAKTLHCPVVLCNQVGGNDSLIFDGNSFYLAPDGDLLVKAKAFEEDLLLVDTEALSEPLSPREEEPVQALFQALVLGVRDYFRKQGFSKALLGVSGGIDSAVVACIAAEALGAENVLGIAMPSRYSSPGSLDDAQALAQNLGIGYKVIPIEGPFQTYLELLTPEFAHKPADITEENLQPRIRGMILMAFSNKFGYIVLATGNKSEMAMGYATLYGDMCGGLGVINDVTKQQVYSLARWINREGEVIPISTITKPPSAELRPNQKDSDSLPDYVILDAVLEDYIERHIPAETIAATHGYPLALVKELIARIHRNEYKRRQAPPGLRVSQKAFSVGRRFPIVHGWKE